MTFLVTALKFPQNILRQISCHRKNCSQPYFFKRNQSSDNRSHGFGAKFLLKKLSASDFCYERKSAFMKVILLSKVMPKNLSEDSTKEGRRIKIK